MKKLIILLLLLPLLLIATTTDISDRIGESEITSPAENQILKYYDDSGNLYLINSDDLELDELILDTLYVRAINIESDGTGAKLIITGKSDVTADAIIILSATGATTVQGLKIWYDRSTAYGYIDNQYNNVDGRIYIRTKTAGTPINAITIFGTGNIAMDKDLDVTGDIIADSIYIRVIEVTEKVTADSVVIGDSLYVGSNMNIDGVAYFADGSNSAPSITFASDTDTGFYLNGSALDVVLGGTTKWKLTVSSFYGTNTNAAQLDSTTPTATIPGHTFSNDTDTGIGSAATDQLSLIAGGDELMRLVEDAGGNYIEPKAEFRIGTIYLTPDGRTMTFSDMQVSDAGSGGVDMSAGFKIDGNTIFRYGAEEDGSGGIQNEYVEINAADFEVISTVDGGGMFWKIQHLSAGAVGTFGSGANMGATNAIPYWILAATTQYAFFDAHIHDDWDGDSDLWVTVLVGLDAAETAQDTIHASLRCDYLTAGDDIASTRTQTLSCDVTIGTDNGEGLVHELVFQIDEDLGSNEVEFGDLINFKFWLDNITDDGTYDSVESVRFLGADFEYRTKNPKAIYTTDPTVSYNDGK